MKKRILCVVFALMMAVLCFPLSSCAKASPEKGTVTRVTVDINPSVEFIVDDQNKVVSVTALNDDGSILIAGEAFVGKTPEEAVEMMVSLATETGYLVKGNVEADENTVTVSVSGDTRYAKQLIKDIEKTADSVMKKLDIEGKVAKAEALKIEALREMALATALYTEEEVNAMDENQLYQVIAAGRIETALLLTEEMRKAYYSAKEYKISFAESEATANVIKSLGGLYNLTYAAYKGALDLYSAAITKLDEFRYDTLVSPESEYQKKLAELRESKTQLLKQRNYTASLDINGEEYKSATITLQLSEENYNKALAAYEALGEKLNESLEKLISALRQSEAKLRELETTMFDDNIEAKLAEKASEIEASMNAAKDSFFAEFEKAHSDDIKAIEASLIAKKAELKANAEKR